MASTPTDQKIMDSVLEAIGKTPLVRLNCIPQSFGLECEVLAKCEFFNAGGSIKDRIGLRMVEDAEKSGRIKKGDTLIEPTSGNTGIGLALAAAIKGYRCIITLPEKMSKEKVDVLKALGAEIVRTPTEAAWDAPDSHISVARRLNKEIPNSHILDQYTNPSNPLAHYEGTAEEILRQCDGKIDMFVAGAGTGGTISGVARKLKEKCPDCIIVGVDPVGSILAVPDSMNDTKRLEAYQVEGIGYDFIPDVLDRTLVDRWIKSEDQASFTMCRRLIREEGMLCGGSCGSAMAGAMEAAKSLKKGQRCVVILPDSTRNYMTKFLSDEWMQDNNFLPDDLLKDESQWWSNRTVAELNVSTPCTVRGSVTIRDATKIMEAQSFDQLPVVGDKDEVLGVITAGNVAAKLTSKAIKSSDPVTKALYSQFKTIHMNTPLWKLGRIFDKDHFALVVQSHKTFNAENEVEEKSVVTGVVSRIDLLKYITNEAAGAK